MPLLHRFSSNLSGSISPLRRYHQTLVEFYSLFNTQNGVIDFFDLLLRQCNTIHLCKQVHAQVVATGNHRVAFVAARVVSAYARFGRLFDAQKVFADALIKCTSNLLLWNSIFRANVSRGSYEKALQLYVKMRELGVFGDGFTLPLLTRACAFMGSSSLFKIVHCHVLELGYQSNLHVVNELMGMYAKLDRMGDARKLFDRMPVKNFVSWNVIVSGYAFNYNCNGALEMFRRMESEGLKPNLVTWTSLISSHARCGRIEETMELFGLMRMRGIGVNAEAIAVVLSVCAELGAAHKSKIIHGYAIKAGLEGYVFVKNSLISVYGKRGDVKDALTLFQEMESKNIVTWNSLITSHLDAGLLDEALELFSQLERSDLRPDTVTWTTLIDGFSLKGQGEKSLELFRLMQSAKVSPNAVTIAGILSVCAELSAVRLGIEIHGHVIRAWMDKNILVENGLVNMYTKCGHLKAGQLLFEKIGKKDIISWNSMITGYGMHGYGMNAVETFKEMIESGSKPNGITFVAVLSACSHAGLVTEGRRLFEKMFTGYGIEPQMEHYACMVDLLGRVGLLQEASLIVKNMPMKPNACVWGALLNSCRIHKNTEIAEEIASNVLSLNTGITGSYMLLSNIYAANGRWQDSARVRVSARTKGFKKNRGQSWIEIKKKNYMFSAGSSVEKGLEEAYSVLEQLALQMESEDRICDSSTILQSVNEVGIMIY